MYHTRVYIHIGSKVIPYLTLNFPNPWLSRNQIYQNERQRPLDKNAKNVLNNYFWSGSKAEATQRMDPKLSMSECLNMRHVTIKFHPNQ
jgi:hypothetical protein